MYSGKILIQTKYYRPRCAQCHDGCVYKVLGAWVLFSLEQRESAMGIPNEMCLWPVLSSKYNLSKDEEKKDLSTQVVTNDTHWLL